MFDCSKKKINRVFILGAGFSYHISGGYFPLMAQLGNEFKDKHCWVSDYLSDKHTDVNLEKILTRVELDIEDEKSSKTIDNLKEHISDIKKFLKLRLSINKIGKDQIEKAQSLCSMLFMDSDSIITFNYDCLLEHILWNLKFWSPNGGYGDAPILNSLSTFGSQVEKNPKGIIVLKPHGSLNFVEPENFVGSEAKRGDIYLQPWISNELFPGINANWSKEPQSPRIVLPSYAKIFGDTRTYVHIWHEAIEKIKKADIIIFIGYSLPKSDTTAMVLLSFINAFEFKARIKKLRIGILNKGPDAHALFDKLYKVGRFGCEDIDPFILNTSDDNDYDRLCVWARQTM